jgi:quercetin dioxygenase-like cupin family protein
LDTPYSYIADLLAETPNVPADSIISRTVYSDDHIKVILFGFAAGQELSEHTASQAAQLYFVQGEADLTLGEDSLSAQSGTWVHMPPKLPHSITAKTPVFMLLTMFHTDSSV